MEIINKVTSSGIITVNLEDYYDRNERIIYDIKNNLYEGLILKEKDFRSFIKLNDWSFYKNKNVGIVCTVDVIIPTWAYMLLISKIFPFANHVIIGSLEQLEQSLFQMQLAKLDLRQFKDAKVVIKGCGNIFIPHFVYGEITRMLLPIVSSLMYGEPCSTVPVFKSKKE